MPFCRPCAAFLAFQLNINMFLVVSSDFLFNLSTDGLLPIFLSKATMSTGN